MASREHVPVAGFEDIVVARDAAAGYTGIIAIHSTRRGPALGGTRLWPYRSHAEALTDVTRLARAMSYKAATLGVELGGGKAVIIADGSMADREACFRAHGRAIEELGGRFITSIDVGTTPADLRVLRQETAHVTGLQRDPSDTTGLGVWRGMQAAARHRWGSDRLRGRTVLVQGAGKVASALCRELGREGARLVVADVDASKAARLAEAVGGRTVPAEALYDEPGDIYAPCALGATLNDATLPRLKVEIIAGGANNQLAEERHGAELDRLGLLYAPDYVINGGGLASVFGELVGWSEEAVRQKALGIYETILEVLSLAARERIPTFRAADQLAEQRLNV